MAEFDPLEERHHFEFWLFEMEGSLRRFMRGPAAGIAGELDYSIESLKVLERWILENYRDGRALLRPEEAEVLDGLNRYVGETLRRQAGGSWKISLKNPGDGFYGIPIIESKAAPIAPLSLVTAAAQRREGGFLAQVAEHLRRWNQG